jgi:hypothetical protein
MNKFELVRSVVQSKLTGLPGTPLRLLDVGCRGCELKPYVSDLAEYEGVDLVQNPQGSVDHVLDVSNGLPFADASFDYVVALDLVEHLDDFEGGLRELLRVARGHLIVMLPNLAHVLFRARFLLGGTLSGKYDMKYGMGKDRHRWVTVQTQCDRLMDDFARDNGLSLTTTWFTDSPKKDLFAKLCRVVGLSPNLWSWASLHVLDRTTAASAAIGGVDPRRARPD